MLDSPECGVFGPEGNPWVLDCLHASEQGIGPHIDGNPAYGTGNLASPPLGVCPVPPSRRQRRESPTLERLTDHPHHTISLSQPSGAMFFLHNFVSSSGAGDACLRMNKGKFASLYEATRSLPPTTHHRLRLTYPPVALR